MGISQEPFVSKFTGKIADPNFTTFIEHQALTVTVRTPQCGHTVWGKKQPCKSSRDSGLQFAFCTNDQTFSTVAADIASRDAAKRIANDCLPFPASGWNLSKTPFISSWGKAFALATALQINTCDCAWRQDCPSRPTYTPQFIPTFQMLLSSGPRQSTRPFIPSSCPHPSSSPGSFLLVTCDDTEYDLGCSIN